MIHNMAAMFNFIMNYRCPKHTDDFNQQVSVFWFKSVVEYNRVNLLKFCPQEQL